MKEGPPQSLTGVPKRPAQQNDAIPRVPPKWLKHDRHVSRRIRYTSPRRLLSNLFIILVAPGQPRHLNHLQSVSLSDLLFLILPTGPQLQGLLPRARRREPDGELPHQEVHHLLLPGR